MSNNKNIEVLKYLSNMCLAIGTATVVAVMLAVAVPQKPLADIGLGLFVLSVVAGEALLVGLVLASMVDDRSDSKRKK